jgi:hypothetical protein
MHLMTIEKEEQYARSRIEIIDAHTRPLLREMGLHKGRVAMRGAQSVGLGVLTVGLSRVGLDAVAVVSAGSTIGALSTAVTRHMGYVRPLDQKISALIHEAETIADDAGIDFETGYVHPENRPVGKRMVRLLGRTSVARLV